MPYRSASFSVPDSRDDCLPPVRSASFPAFNNLFESSVLNESLMGRVSVDLQIRQKRRGQWFETNVNPSKIGKMRRCVLKFSKIIRSATVTIESSALKLLNYLNGVNLLLMVHKKLNLMLNHQKILKFNF